MSTTIDVSYYDDGIEVTAQDEREDRTLYSAFAGLEKNSPDGRRFVRLHVDHCLHEFPISAQPLL